MQQSVLRSAADAAFDKARFETTALTDDLLTAYAALRQAKPPPPEIEQEAQPVAAPPPVAVGALPLFRIAIETGATSPPFGAALFVMKAVAPKNTTMRDIYGAAIPFVICDLVAIAIVFAFPQIVLWPLSFL